MESKMVSDHMIKMDRLREFYNIDFDGKVYFFLFDHQYLYDILFEAIPYIKKYYPNRSKCVLYFDSFFNALTVRIYTPMSLDDAEREMFKFDREWFNGVIPRCKSKLCITC